MSRIDYQHFEAGTKRVIFPKEHEAVREIFDDTITAVIRRELAQQGSGEQDVEPAVTPRRIELKTLLTDFSVVLIHVAQTIDEQGLYSSASLNWQSGSREGEATDFLPDDETGGVVRRDVSVAARHLGALSILRSRGYSATEDLQRTRLLPGSEKILDQGIRERPVGIEEMYWLADVIENAVPQCMTNI